MARATGSGRRRVRQDISDQGVQRRELVADPRATVRRRADAEQQPNFLQRDACAEALARRSVVAGGSVRLARRLNVRRGSSEPSVHLAYDAGGRVRGCARLTPHREQCVCVEDLTCRVRPHHRAEARVRIRQGDRLALETHSRERRHGLLDIHHGTALDGKLRTMLRHVHPHISTRRAGERHFLSDWVEEQLCSSLGGSLRLLGDATDGPDAAIRLDGARHVHVRLNAPALEGRDRAHRHDAPCAGAADELRAAAHDEEEIPLRHFDPRHAPRDANRQTCRALHVHLRERLRVHEQQPRAGPLRDAHVRHAPH